MLLGTILATITWATATEGYTIPPTSLIVVGIALICLMGLITYSAHRNRPWWPKTKAEKRNEMTRQITETGWSEAIRIAQNLAEVMDEAVKQFEQPADVKEQVIHGLTRQTIKGTKAGIALLQSGFPEAAVSIWRTLFEIRVNSEYIKNRSPGTAQRFMEQAELQHLKRTNPEDDGVRQVEKDWKSKSLKPDNPNGWTGNPVENLTKRAEWIGIMNGESPSDLTDLDLYRLANIFVHTDWVATSRAVGMSDVRNTDGSAEGIGEVLYSILKTSSDTIGLTAPKQTQEKLKEELLKLNTQIRGAPAWLQGRFVRIPGTQVLRIPGGEWIIHTTKRREEWPTDAAIRTERELRDVFSAGAEKIVRAVANEDELADLRTRTKEFVEQHRSRVEQIFDSKEASAWTKAIYASPQVPIILMLLEKDKDNVVDQWEEHLPYAFLEDLTTSWGIDITPHQATNGVDLEPTGTTNAEESK